MALDMAGVALSIGIISAGLFAGLMLTLVVLLDRVWRVPSDREAVAALQVFLRTAKGDPVITAVMLLQFVAPIVAVVTLWSPDRTGSVLTLVGATAAAGPLVVTFGWNFPIYATVSAWRPEAPPADWAEVRHQFRRLNTARLALTLFAAICYLITLSR